MGRTTSNILSSCLDDIRAGRLDIAGCLSQHPRQATALRPLLQTALRIKPPVAVGVDPEFRARARAQLVAAISADQRGAAHRSPDRQPGGLFFGIRFRRRLTSRPLRLAAGALAILLVFVIALGGGAALASQKTLPGDTLYAVKIGVEKLQMSLMRDDEEKAVGYTECATRRLEEINGALDMRRAVAAGAAAEDFSGCLEQTEVHLLKAASSGKDVTGLASRLSEQIAWQRSVVSVRKNGAPAPAWDALVAAEAEAARVQEACTAIAQDSLPQSPPTSGPQLPQTVVPQSPPASPVLPGALASNDGPLAEPEPPTITPVPQSLPDVRDTPQAQQQNSQDNHLIVLPTDQRNSGSGEEDREGVRNEEDGSRESPSEASGPSSGPGPDALSDAGDGQLSSQGPDSPTPLLDTGSDNSGPGGSDEDVTQGDTSQSSGSNESQITTPTQDDGKTGQSSGSGSGDILDTQTTTTTQPQTKAEDNSGPGSGEKLDAPTATPAQTKEIARPVPVAVGAGDQEYGPGAAKPKGKGETASGSDDSDDNLEKVSRSGSSDG